jgi:hypothetical protein
MKMMKCQPDLLEIIQTGGASRCPAGLLHGRQQEPY